MSTVKQTSFLAVWNVYFKSIKSFIEEKKMETKINFLFPPH